MKTKSSRPKLSSLHHLSHGEPTRLAWNPKNALLVAISFHQFYHLSEGQKNKKKMEDQGRLGGSVT